MADGREERPKQAPPDYLTVENSDLPTYEEALRLDPAQGARDTPARWEGGPPEDL